MTRNLIVLVADKKMDQALSAVLKRPAAIGIRPITFDVYSHPRKDPGVANEAVPFLRPFRNLYSGALVVFDWEGSGYDQSGQDRDALCSRLETELRDTGWKFASVVAIDPELEAWVWSTSPHVERALGWNMHVPALREWLIGRGFLTPGEVKPRRPKEAMMAALKETSTPLSGAIYRQLAESVSLANCQDPTFRRLLTSLVAAYPPEGHPYGAR